MPKVKPIVSIENVVATATIAESLDLDFLANRLPSSSYEPKKFPGLVFKQPKPATTTLIFSSGKLVCTGARSEAQARRAVAQVVKMLKEKGLNVYAEPKLTIQNVVGTASLGGTVLVEELAKRMKASIYEPELFPGAIHRMEEPEVVFLIFSSGKLVCVGAKKESDVYKAIGKLHETLEGKGLIAY